MMHKLLLSLCVAAALVGVSRADDTAELLVQTTTGAVMGHYSDGVREWQGIPYAAPPVGELRWAQAEDATPWDDVRVADFDAPGCPQDCNLPPGNCPLETSEDCLYLSVWSPMGEAPAEGYPVFFWIHGGAYTQGYGNAALYNGTKFTQRDVVTVVINYRLGALGFMASTTMEGNYGMLDQRKGMEWVRDNIAAFGGNPDDVTIAGQSAGAMSVGTHMTSKGSQGLFTKAIMESNPWGLPFHTRDTAEQNAEDVAAYVGCDVSDMDCLRAVPADDIVEAQNNAVELDLQNLFLNFLPFTPLVDPTGELPKQPLYAFQDGEFSDVPTMNGHVINDAWLFVMELFTVPMGEAAYDLSLRLIFGRQHYDEIIAMYPADLLGNTDDTRPVLDVLGTDLLFMCPEANMTEQIDPAVRTSPWYSYDFTHFLSFDCWGENYTYCYDTTNDYVCHGSELPLVWDVFTDGTLIYYPDDDEIELTQNMQAYWANFVKTADPNKGDDTPQDWPVFETPDEPWIVLENPMDMEYNPRAEYCALWDQLGFFW